MEKDRKRKPEGKTGKSKAPSKRKGEKVKGTKCVWTTRIDPPLTIGPRPVSLSGVSSALRCVGYVREQLKTIKAPDVDKLARILEVVELQLQRTLRANIPKPLRPAKQPKRISTIHRPHSSRGHTHVILERAVWNTGTAADASLA